MDAFVPATAEAHGFTLVTRNIEDFQRIGIFFAGSFGDALLA
jgi:predicted nucleic acid-binding protein